MVLYWTCESFADQKFKMAAMRKLSLTLDSMAISHLHLLFRNQYWTTIMLKNKQTIIKQCVKSLFTLILICQLYARWAITGSWEPLGKLTKMIKFDLESIDLDFFSLRPYSIQTLFFHWNHTADKLFLRSYCTWT